MPATAAPWSSQLVSLAGTWISTGYRLLCQGSSPACKTCRGLGHEMEVRKWEQMYIEVVLLLLSVAELIFPVLVVFPRPGP